MAGNVPGTGGSVLPGVFTEVKTSSRGASIPGGTRIAAIIGEGSTSEVIVSSALGGGQDGFDGYYVSTSGSDGRHFTLSLSPVVSNRTRLFKNGVPLVGLEEAIDQDSFNSAYDYRINITNGQIELQTAQLVDQGGAFYTASSANVGQGTLEGLSLLDENAPTETWTIKCISVQRTALNAPIANTAKFIAFGSVSGPKLDANGNPVVWTANNTTTNNNILQFSILEGGTAFREGDAFVIKVKSGALNKNDTLTASYIPTSYLNSPEFLESMTDVVKKHGLSSLDNNLSLGCQLAFSNGTPGIMCVQAAPPLPRRTSYTLSDGVRALSTDTDDFVFALPLGVKPATDANIRFFVKNNSTNVETQVLPNKFTYYAIDTVGNPNLNTFVMDDTLAPSGYSFSYSVISQAASIASGLDGYMARVPANGQQGIFSSSVQFDSSYVGKTLKVIDATNVANNGSFTVASVANGDLYVTASSFDDFITESNIDFEVIDENGNVIAGKTGTDGVLTDTNTFTATLASVAIDFSDITSPTTKRVRIAGSTDGLNDGLYDITAYSGGGDSFTLQKAFVEETGLRFEVIDSDQTSYYVVVNHNVVPNGYSLRVNIVDDRDASFFDAGWINALESLEVEEIDILSPLPKQTISVIFQNALTHCKTMSSIKNKKERVLFCGAINGLTVENLTGTKAAAVEDIGILEGIQGDDVAEVLAGTVEDLTNYSVKDAFGGTYRCVYFYPDQIVVQAGADNLLVDGFYIAAAAAGYLSGVTNVAIPLTNKVLSGFTILRNKQFSPLKLEQLVAAGVTVLQPVSGGGKVIWGLTTTQSGFAEEQEISIVFIRDRIAKTLRGAFEGFIGIAEDDTIVQTLSARALATLQSFLSQGLITAYRDLRVERDSVDPRQWNVFVAVQPVYPVNFIYIQVDLGVL